MIVRDPYTGTEIAPRPRRGFAQRWWPALVILLIAAIAGFAEWRGATHNRVSAPAPVVTSPSAPSPKPPSAASPAIAGSDSAVAAAALLQASEHLEHVADLLIGIAALQLGALAVQLYLLGRQRRAPPDEQ